MRSRSIFLPLLLAAMCSLVAAQERYLMPVDEGAKDASFLAFRNRLIAAVEKKDVKFLLSIIDPRIKIGFGGDDGIAEFKKYWKINHKGSRFWDEFSRVIKNGGKFDGSGKRIYSTFTAPYTFTSWPENVDAYHAIIGRDVNLREVPSADSKIIDRLSYNIVTLNFDESVKIGTGDEDRRYEWAKVETLGGKKGFVKGEFVRGHLDYRASFEKQRGVWKLIFFVAGD